MTNEVILKNLQAQIRDLQSQINPVQDQEKQLDDLYQLQLERQKNINENGLTVTFGSGEKTFKCLKANDSTVYFQAGIPVCPSMQIKHNGSLLGIITGSSPQAGRIKCTIFSPRSTAQAFEKSATATGNNLKQSGTSIPCLLSGDTLTTYNQPIVVGTIVKCSDTFFEVTGSYSDNGLHVHQLAPYGDQEKQAPMSHRQTPNMINGCIISRTH